MKAVIYINGLIGTWENEKGIELTDIVSQVQAQKNFDEVEVRIGNSIGGVVQVGYDIYDYLKSLKRPITTVIESYCASITSIIFLAGETRLMRNGAKLMIHNPWGKPEGNADDLEQYAAELRLIEKRLADIYNEKTSIGKEALLALMRNETEMTAEEAVKIGFATGVADEMKIVAHLKLGNMSKKTLKEQLKGVLSKLSGDPVGLTIADSTGKEIVFDTENEIPAVGDKATIDGAPAAGEFVMPDGKTFVFENGELKEIKEPAPGGDEMANTIRQIVREEMAAFRGEVNENLGMVAEATESLTEKYSVLAKSVKSNFQVPPKEDKNKLDKSKGQDDVYDKYKPKKKED